MPCSPSMWSSQVCQVTVFLIPRNSRAMVSPRMERFLPSWWTFLATTSIVSKASSVVDWLSICSWYVVCMKQWYMAQTGAQSLVAPLPCNTSSNVKVIIRWCPWPLLPYQHLATSYFIHSRWQNYARAWLSGLKVSMVQTNLDSKARILPTRSMMRMQAIVPYKELALIHYHKVSLTARLVSWVRIE